MRELKFYLTKSPNSNKKFRISFENNSKTINVDFGQAGASDYTLHKQSSRMALYVRRHGGVWNEKVAKLMEKLKTSKKKDKDFKLSKADRDIIHENMKSSKISTKEEWGKGGINKPGFWSRWLTWSEPTIQKAIKLIHKKFNIKIVRQSKPGKPSRKTSRKPVRKTSRKTSRKPARKTSRKTSRKTIKKKDTMIKERYNFKISKNIPDNVLNKTLYINVKKEVKRSVKAWPSAYASAQLVHLYKKRGGKYTRKKKSGKDGLHRWFDEKWINVCALPKIEKCGRSSSNNLKKWKEKYPYCRPMIKVNKSTPKLESKLTRRQIKSICKKKREDPTIKIKLIHIKN